MVDLSEDKLTDDNDSDRESYFSDSEFKNTPMLLLICNQQLQQTPVIPLFSLLAILVIFQLQMQLAMRACWNCLAAMMILILPQHPILLTTAGNLSNQFTHLY